ncbi:HrgA protein [Thioclava sp.]|uniref:COG2958 family protein n=1 Tax=Thioclava sp. TaxID=1933450 RepID=UPI00324249A5
MSDPTLQLAKRIPQLLQEHPEHRFKARELAELLLRRFPEACAAKLARSSALETEDQLVQQIVAEIGAQRPQIQQRNPAVRTTESRPRRYYWSDKTDAEEIVEIEAKYEEPPAMSKSPVGAITLQIVGTEEEPQSLTEYNLYPLLGEYLYREAGVDAMRIDERRGSNARGSGGNRWLYPDVVGLEDLTRGWDDELRHCVRETGNARALLWSLEVKLHLNRANVRESYFQAVSNSSWANFGYLVAAEIEGHGTMQELRMLSALHGIGVLQLDAENPSESNILIPARGRSEVDWSTCNRLVIENPDFKNFIKRVRQFYQTGDRPVNWDLVPGQVRR